MEIRRVAGALGAEITGVDLRDPALDIAELEAVLWEHEVIFFRGANLTEEEHFNLGTRFGTPSIFPVARVMGATEATMTVLTDGPDSPNAADRWHTDVTWTSTPPKYALLHMEEPCETGGDTLWASGSAAYQHLSEPMRNLLASLTAVHTNSRFVERVLQKAGDAGEDIAKAIRAAYPPVEHPLIRTHPDTGKRALFFAETFLSHIVGLTASENDTLLAFLREHVKEPSLHCRWQWQAGDLAIWDERCTMHRAAADHFPQRRVVRRMEIDGDRPFFDPAR